MRLSNRYRRSCIRYHEIDSSCTRTNHTSQHQASSGSQGCSFHHRNPPSSNALSLSSRYPRVSPPKVGFFVPTKVGEPRYSATYSPFAPENCSDEFRFIPYSEIRASNLALIPDKSKLVCPHNHLEPAIDPQLCHDGGHVGLDRRFTHKQFLRDLLIRVGLT